MRSPTEWIVAIHSNSYQLIKLHFFIILFALSIRWDMSLPSFHLLRRCYGRLELRQRSLTCSHFLGSSPGSVLAKLPKKIVNKIHQKSSAVFCLDWKGSIKPDGSIKTSKELCRLPKETSQKKSRSSSSSDFVRAMKAAADLGSSRFVFEERRCLAPLSV